MQLLTIEPTLPFPIPAEREFTIALIGCGGTGSHIAQVLARLAAHCRESGGPELTLVFVDGDTVEPKNVGRQLFCTADVGKNKAQVLAARLNAVFGLKIHAFPQMLNGQHMQALGYGVLIGAVDGARGRREIQRELSRYSGNWQLWLDCGNHEYAGQVCVGNTLDSADFVGALQFGLCARLPAPSLVYPDLLQEAPIVPRADCAAAMEDNAQSLMVNQMVAAVAGQYLYQIVIERRITTFCTTVDLRSLSMRSLSITATNIATAIGVTPDVLMGTHKKRKGKAA